MWSWSWSNEVYSVCLCIRMDALLVDSLRSFISRPCAALHLQNKQVCIFWGFFCHERRVETLLKGIHICKLLRIVSISLSLSWSCSRGEVTWWAHACSCIGPLAGFIALETCKTGPIPATAPWWVQVRLWENAIKNWARFEGISLSQQTSQTIYVLLWVQGAKE